MEKTVKLIALTLVLLIGLIHLVFNIYNGYTSIAMYLSSLIFIAVPLVLLLKSSIANKIPQKYKNVNPMLIMNTALILFLCIGLFLTGFLIKLGITHWGGYLVSVTFILFPAFLLYGLKYGFTISDKQYKAREERRSTLNFDDKNLSIIMPLFNITKVIEWKSIETIIYTNYMSDDNAYFTFYLTKVPHYIKHEKIWWLNRLFPLSNSKRKKIIVDDETRNFYQIPEMVEKYLNHSVSVDITIDPRKGTLIAEKQVIKGMHFKTEQHWKPNTNYDREKLVYDKYNRNLEQIQQRKKTNHL